MKAKILSCVLAGLLTACVPPRADDSSDTNLQRALDVIPGTAMQRTEKYCTFFEPREDGDYSDPAKINYIFFTVFDDPGNRAYVKYNREHLKLAPAPGDIPVGNSGENRAVRYYAMDYPDYEITVNLVEGESVSETVNYTGTIGFTAPFIGETRPFVGTCGV